MSAEFAYSNESPRRRGRVLTAAGLVVPGIARVHASVAPVARYWECANVDAVASGRPVWAALGDSLTQGIGASAPGRGWVAELSGAVPYPVVNLGVSGATTQDVLERQIPALASVDAALVTLMIGSNDLMRPRTRRGLPERFEQLLQQLPAGSVVTTLPNPSRVADRVNATIERVAAARGLVVAELRDARLASWRGRLAADHFHPNDAGYAAIAEVLADVVTRAGHQS